MMLVVVDGVMKDAVVELSWGHVLLVLGFHEFVVYVVDICSEFIVNHGVVFLELLWVILGLELRDLFFPVGVVGIVLSVVE